MVDEVQRHNGVLDKFIGDAIMAVFGVPFPEADDPVRAVRTALRMEEALAAFNVARAGRGLAPILTGIGINTGEVVYGNIGSESRSDFTVVGDAVNLASRLEGLNKLYGSHVLVSEFTRRELGDHFALRVVDHVRVKGKTEPTEIYEVLGDRDYQPTAAQACFAPGFVAYRRGAFTEALDHFCRGADEDPLCRVFTSRCNLLLASPPPPDWDGVWRLPTK
jgi:adenylate cyclase